MDVDEFAQTRAPDDLFDEDYTPVSPVVTTQSASTESHQHPHQHPHPYPHQHGEQDSYQNTNTRGNGQLPRRSRHNNRNNSNNSDNFNHNRATVHPRDRGRGGRRRGDQNRNAEQEKKKKPGLAESKWSGNTPKDKVDGDVEIVEDVVDDGAGKEAMAMQDSEGKGAEQVEQDGDVSHADARKGDVSDGGGGEDGVFSADNEVPETAEKAEKAEKRESAVRGDRSATGGPKRTKLTEAELTARLSEMSLKNASLTAAHKRAEADEASFQAREAKAATRRIEERANRTQMLGERERNAQRKLRALGHREWDVNKREEDYDTNGIRGGGSRGNGRSGMARGGAAAAAAAAVEPAPADERHGYETRPRHGNRNGGRGRGRGRGNSSSNKSNGLNSSRYAQPQQSPPDQNADFPPLPTVAARQDESPAAPSQDKQAANLNSQETGRGTNDERESQNDPVTERTAQEPEPEPEPMPSVDPERKESLTMSELGGQLGGQSASWADQVEGAAG